VGWLFVGVGVCVRAHVILCLQVLVCTNMCMWEREREFERERSVYVGNGQQVIAH
jgi:hypothetical protein